jgi:hypothetical protein
MINERDRAVSTALVNIAREGGVVEIVMLLAFDESGRQLIASWKEGDAGVKLVERSNSEIVSFGVRE